MTNFEFLLQNMRPVGIDVTNLTSNEFAPYVSNYAVNAHVSGLYARVSTEFTIYNPNSRILEGELEFPLPDDAVVCGYAIDINGTMVDGAVVEKQKARIAFENEVKKGIDPGLVEQQKGNAYRTRIYPLPCTGERRIRVDYLTPLVLGTQGDAALALPMPRVKLIRRDVSISVEIPGTDAPIIGGLGSRQFAQAKAVWQVEAHDENVTPGDDLLIAVPKLPEIISLVENNDGDYYFTANISIPKTASSEEKKDLPKNWRILWDASGSRQPSDIAAARKLLESLPESASYELHVFRNTPEEAKTFSTRAALLETIDAVSYDGGTDFSSIAPLASQTFDGLTLLFSDGMDTYEGSLPQLGAGSVAIMSGKTRDISSLRRICGGKVIDISILSSKEALDQILDPSPVIASVQGANVCHIQGIGASAIGRVGILGILKASQAQISVELSDGRTFPITLSRDKAEPGKTLATAWAAKRIDELSPVADEHREELLAIGRRFCIVSPVTSLIVFERLSQWIEYDIEPPESLTEFHAEWLKAHTKKQNADSDARAQKQWVDKLLNNWQERVNWWLNPIPVPTFHNSGAFDDIEQDRAAAAGAPRRELRAAPRHARPVMRAENAAMGGAPMAPPRGMPMAAPAPMAMSAPMPAPPLGEMRERRAPVMMDMDEEVSAREAYYEESAAPTPEETPNVSANMVIKQWDPNTPYLTALKDVQKIFNDTDSLYREYIKQRSKYGNSPSFYLDCAGFFFKAKEHSLAVRILSNLAELKIEDVALLRVYAWRLREAGELKESLRILRKIAKIRSDEVVSWRDLALTLTLLAKADNNAEAAEEALQLFKKAAFSPWKRSDAMWSSLVALEEFNALSEWCKRQKWEGKSPEIPVLEDKFIKLLDTDLRIVMMWDADDTDIDLHVLEPTGEEVYYGNHLSHTGGLVSFDVRTGYGPEEYLQKKAPKGIYKVLSNFYSSHQQKLTGPVTVTVTIFTNWGRENETCQTMSLRLEHAKDKVFVGQITVD